MENDGILAGKVTGITKFGAFVALEDGRTGMVHISEVAHTFVNDIREHLTEGQEVLVKVIGEGSDRRISLSIKKATAPPPKVFAGARRSAAGPATFEDKLKAFMSESESKISDMRRQSDRHGAKRRK